MAFAVQKLNNRGDWMLNGLKDRMFNISSSARRIILISAIALFTVTTVVCAISICHKQITIVDGDNSPNEVSTFNRYVEDVLKSQNIALYEGDKLSAKLDDKLTDNMKIEIYRAFSVTVTEKGIKKEY